MVIEAVSHAESETLLPALFLLKLSVGCGEPLSRGTRQRESKTGNLPASVYQLAERRMIF
jgi:hypothetical protein